MFELTEALSPIQQVEREELDRAFNAVFATAHGKRVLFWMMEQCAIYEDAYRGEETHATSAKLGEQRVGRKLIAMLDSIDPRMYPQLLLDRAEIKRLDSAAASARGGKDQPGGMEDE